VCWCLWVCGLLECEWVVLVCVCVCVCVGVGVGVGVCGCVCGGCEGVFPRSHLLTLSTEDSHCSRTAGFSPNQEISPF